MRRPPARCRSRLRDRLERADLFRAHAALPAPATTGAARTPDQARGCRRTGSSRDRGIKTALQGPRAARRARTTED